MMNIHPGMIMPNSQAPFQQPPLSYQADKNKISSQYKPAPKMSSSSQQQPAISPNPITPNLIDHKGGNSLGFQMNPVSKNRKK
jgi:hypothetical protein